MYIDPVLSPEVYQRSFWPPQMTPHPVQQFKCDLSGMAECNLKCFLLYQNMKVYLRVLDDLLC